MYGSTASYKVTLPTRPISFKRGFLGHEPTGHFNYQQLDHGLFKKGKGKEKGGEGRHLVYIIRDIRKPTLPHPTRNTRRNIHRPPKQPTRPVQLLLPLLYHNRLLMRPVIRMRPRLVLLHLHPSPGLNMLVRLPQKPPPIANAPAHGPRMDKIKRLVLGKRPIALRVVDEEAAVGRREARLDGAEVCPHDLGVREVLCHFEGPDAGSRADIEDAFWSARAGDGGTVEATADQQAEEMVHEGETVLFFLVVGDGVLAVAVGVVSAAILVVVVADGGGDGEVGVDDGLGIVDGVLVACLGWSVINTHFE